MGVKVMLTSMGRMPPHVTLRLGTDVKLAVLHRKGAALATDACNNNVPKVSMKVLSLIISNHITCFF